MRVASVGSARSLMFYVLVPVIGGFAPLVVVPAITSEYGPAVWGSVAVAQSIGGGLGIMAELGWGVTGPQRIAGLDPLGRSRMFRSSVWSKLIAVCALAPLSGVISAALSDADRVAVALVAGGATLSALQQTWFFYGLDRPQLALGTDTLPRVAAALLAGALLFAHAPLVIYGVISVLQPIVSLALAVRTARVRLGRVGSGLADGVASIRSQRVITLGRSIAAGYTALPVAIVRLASPSSVPDFAAMDRVMRMGLGVLTAVPNRLQNWLGKVSGAELLRRCRVSFWLNVGLGCGAAAIYGLAISPTVRLLFSGTIDVEPLSAVFFGSVVAAICTSRGAGLWLVGLGNVNSVAFAMTASALVGVPAIYLLARVGGVAGGAAGELVAEIVGVAVQVGMAVKGERRVRAGA